jgi:preprotein translocase subunit SecY
MLERFANIFKIPELRDRILFTLLILLVYRIGGHVPLAGINASALGEFMDQNRTTLFGLYDMFVGGAFERATVFALGIMPYISASIIFQLMGTVVPYFQKLQKEGRRGPQERLPNLRATVPSSSPRCRPVVCRSSSSVWSHLQDCLLCRTRVLDSIY